MARNFHLKTLMKSRNKLKGRINNDLICPMNWLQEWLDKIQGQAKLLLFQQKIFSLKWMVQHQVHK